MTLQKKQLSGPRQRFLELMQLMPFCRIQRLELHDGQPVFEPPPTVVQDLKIGGNNDPRVEIHLRNYTLKQAHLELFQHFDEIKDGMIDELEVRFGLPQMLRLKRTVA
ncbi:MAG: hypothetical protein QM703_28595 [Gemmatales bacterium]